MQGNKIPATWTGLGVLNGPEGPQDPYSELGILVVQPTGRFELGYWNRKNLLELRERNKVESWNE